VEVGDVRAVLDVRDDDPVDAPAELLHQVQGQVVGERSADVPGVHPAGDARGLLEPDEDGEDVLTALDAEDDH
jgi:hypothetical protein